MYQIDLKKNDYGEYEVLFKLDGQLMENLTYYTNSEEDAVQTLIAEAQALSAKDIKWKLTARAARLVIKYGLDR